MIPFPRAAIPTSPEAQVSWIRLIRSRRVGPATFQRLMRERGHAEAALEALPQIASEAGLNTYDIYPHDSARRELAAAQKLGAQMLPYGAPNYPQALYDLPDAPAFLWAMGRVDLLACPAVALVGARNASTAGRNMARRLARDLGQAGVAIVSGLARGIDQAAHEASLDTGTIAVMAGGADVNYPAECAALADEVRDRGLILSEMPFGMNPQARNFPIRNRIIAGLGAAVVVVEGAAKSGSLITARNALDQGREVMAVPGSPLDARASGCNMLIRDGAQLVRNAGDVLEGLGFADGQIPQNRKENAQSYPTQNSASHEDAHPKAPFSHDPSKLLSLLGPTPVAEDHVIEHAGLEPTQAMRAIGELELSGQIQRLPGGRLVRISKEHA